MSCTITFPWNVNEKFSNLMSLRVSGEVRVPVTVMSRMPPSSIPDSLFRLAWAALEPSSYENNTHAAAA